MTFSIWKYKVSISGAGMVRKWLPWLLLLACVSAHGRQVCKQGVYIVGVGSARQFEDSGSHMGWTMLVSKQAYYDSTSEFVRSDKGKRVDINTDRGRALFDMAVYAMNMGYRVDVVDNHRTYCDDFDELDIRRLPRR